MTFHLLPIADVFVSGDFMIVARGEVRVGELGFRGVLEGIEWNMSKLEGVGMVERCIRGGEGWLTFGF